MSIDVHPAAPEHLARVGDLTAQAYLADDLIADDHAYVAELRDALRRADEATVLVALEDGAVLGTVTVAEHGSAYAEIATADEGEVRMLAVDPAARGRGIGEALMRAALEHAFGRGADRVVLSSLPAMQAAHRMYERLGLVRAPERDWSIQEATMVVYTTADGDRPRT